MYSASLVIWAVRRGAACRARGRRTSGGAARATAAACTAFRSRMDGARGALSLSFARRRARFGALAPLFQSKRLIIQSKSVLSFRRTKGGAPKRRARAAGAGGNRAGAQSQNPKSAAGVGN